MSNYLNTTITKILFACTVLAFFSCEDDETPNLRIKMSYDDLTATTPYSEPFVNTEGVSTVDLTEGNNRFRMFVAMNSYSSTSISGNTEIDAAKLKNMFNNTGNSFTDITHATGSISGVELNNSGVQLSNVTASSLPIAQAEAVRTHIESIFDQIDAASASLGTTASAGVAGKLGNYLLDAKGIELAQIIQKSLIGALQLDYISNVLLDEGLTADNHLLVGDNNYSQLEHNWDVAYGMLTLNQVYLLGATSTARNSPEFAAGSYIWEYNRANYALVYPAFLKGRAAIVNNDKAELLIQTTIIRTEFEKAIASAALGYLDKWKTETSESARAHAIGEGAGFIYSLRFATLHGADAAFSDSVYNGLLGSTNGFWDLTAEKINTASAAIKAKFNLQ